MSKKRIFSGIQPSGDIHLGNYLGAIQNWVGLLDQYESIFCIVDYHAMTVPYQPELMQQRIYDAALVNIACGLDPDKCTIFVQSHVMEHAELTWIFNCVTPLGELSRMTQFKEKSRQHEKNITIGLLDYPVLQAADILLYKAQVVPVGEDQVQHIEFSREVARKFNTAFGDTFPEPAALLTKSKRIMGTDGKNKMSKSMNNTIGILEDEKTIWDKLRPAFTDENRQRKSDPGNPDICNIFTLHTAFTPPGQVKQIDTDCRQAGIGCIDCKKILLQHLMPALKPIQDKADQLKKDPAYVYNVLKQGAEHCKETAVSVMEEVRQKTGLRENHK